MQDTTPKADQNKIEKRVCLGRIHSAHGLRGLVKIKAYGDNPGLIETLGPVFISETEKETLSVIMKNPAGHYWLAAIEGINDRDSAEALKGIELYQLRAKLPEIEDSESFYYDDLIGCTAYDNSRKQIGSVISVQNYGAGDLLEIKALRGDTFLLPFSRETVPDIDLETRILIIDIPEGLLD